MTNRTEITNAIRDEWRQAERLVRELPLSVETRMVLRAALELNAYRQAAIKICPGTAYDTERAIELVRNDFDLAARIQDEALGRELMAIEF